MKNCFRPARNWIFPLLILLCGLALSACKSTPKINWSSRVGNYTYDQAVLELGPPDKTATLSDGKTVSDWITRINGGLMYGVGTGFYGGHSGVGVREYVSTGYPDRVLRLTFDVDHKLVSWWTNY